MPSYLKSTPFLKFKTLLFNSGLISTAEILHVQALIKIIDAINVRNVILPFSDEVVPT